MDLLNNKGENQTFTCGNAQITFDSNGYIVKINDFSSVMWCKPNQDEELIGMHIIELAKILKKYTTCQEIYINFLECVVLKFYETKEKNRLCSIKNKYTYKSENFAKKFVEKLNNNEFTKDVCPSVGKEFIPTTDAIEKCLKSYDELLASDILDTITRDCRSCQNMSCRVENNEKPVDNCVGYIHHNKMVDDSILGKDCNYKPEQREQNPVLSKKRKMVSK